MIHPLDYFIGRTVVLSVVERPTVTDAPVNARVSRTRTVDLTGWNIDRANGVYRRRNPGVPTQTDVAVSVDAVLNLTLRDAALLLEEAGIQHDAARRR